MTQEDTQTENQASSEQGQAAPELPAAETAPEAVEPAAEATAVPVEAVPLLDSSSIPAGTQNDTGMAELRRKGREKVAAKRQKRFEKLLLFVQQKGSITNDQAEKLLHISDATATRYLSQLVKEGRLKRTGTPEHARYSLP